MMKYNRDERKYDVIVGQKGANGGIVLPEYVIVKK